MYVRDTIAAIATAAAPSGIAIVRVSGGEAAAVADKVFRGFPADGGRTHVLYPGRILDRFGHTVDRGLAVMMRSPRSYTGEDVLELHCHGGPAIARAVLESTLAAGARMAERGEFTARAFSNGKLDLAQAEAVADLVGARTIDAARLAAAQLDGALSRAVAVIREALVGVAARLEGAIDFADEDETGLDRDRTSAEIASVVARLDALAGTYEHGRRVREGATVVLAGAPNVGKSSLANRLLGEERIIVTPIPGTTRDTIEESLDIGGIPVTLVDTAGVRRTADPIERFGVERAEKEIVGADLVLCVVDASAEDTQGFHDALRCKRTIVVLNKMDLPLAVDLGALRRDYPGAPFVRTSAVDGSGIEDLRTAIAAAFERPNGGSDVALTRERHRLAVEAAVGHLGEAACLVAGGHPAEIAALEVSAALTELDGIVGVVSAEDVLDRVFREFCIGK